MPLRTALAPRTRILAAPARTLCLDFANTRYWRGQPTSTETLSDFSALLTWLVQAGVLDADAARALRSLDARAANALLGAALLARESLYRLFSAGDPSREALSELSAWLSETPARSEAVLSPTGPRGWRVSMRQASVAEVLAPVLWSAADLLLAGPPAALRCCANPQCGWLFLDDSKGGTRRWCSMSACGNRAKAKRHSMRQRFNSGDAA